LASNRHTSLFQNKSAVIAPEFDVLATAFSTRQDEGLPRHGAIGGAENRGCGYPGRGSQPPAQRLAGWRFLANEQPVNQPDGCVFG
jgi:hypothetical protein